MCICCSSHLTGTAASQLFPPLAIFATRFVMSPNFVVFQRANDHNVKFSPSSRVGVYFPLVARETDSDPELRVTFSDTRTDVEKIAPMICTT